MNGRFQKSRLLRERLWRRRNGRERHPEHTEASARKVLAAIAELLDECLHDRLDEGELTHHDDGSISVTCPDCGDDSFPLVDVGYEVYRLEAEGHPNCVRRPRGTARQRRLTRQRRMQFVRRWVAWRSGRRAAP